MMNLIYKLKYWIFIIPGSLFFLLTYSAGMYFAFKLWPDMLNLWSWDNLSGFTLFRIPVEEFIWAFLYGATWSLVLAFIFDVRISTGLLQKKTGYN